MTFLINIKNVIMYLVSLESLLFLTLRQIHLAFLPMTDTREDERLWWLTGFTTYCPLILVWLPRYLARSRTSGEMDQINSVLGKLKSLLMPLQGQMISNGLFGVIEFFRKTNEQISHGSINELVH